MAIASSFVLAATGAFAGAEACIGTQSAITLLVVACWSEGDVDPQLAPWGIELIISDPSAPTDKEMW